MSAAASARAENRPWVERYRPRTIEDVASQQHTVNVLRKALTAANLPHMLFYGPPGTGKTSTILALARQLFGPELMKSRVLELNASDERGIGVVREKVKSFARMSVSQPVDGYACPPYKIVVLDEADSMTQDAQGALRRIMEQYSRSTRFCLICNYVTRIIEPLASRCSKFRFRPLEVQASEERLSSIAQAEHMQVTPEIISALINASDGDMRRAITYLQSISRLSLDRGAGGGLSAEAIGELAGLVPQRVIVELAQSVGVESMAMDEEEAPKPMRAGDAFERIFAAVRNVTREGYSCIQVVQQLNEYVVLHTLLNARQKCKCALHFSEADKALLDGGEEELQLLSLCLKLQPFCALLRALRPGWKTGDDDRKDAVCGGSGDGAALTGRLYELFCVAISQVESAPLRDLVQSTSRLVLDHGGAVRNVQYWGKRTLPQRARRHQQYHRTGDYWLMQFDTNTPTLKLLNERMRQDPRVIKWNTLKLGEKLSEIAPPGVSGGGSSSHANAGGKTVDYLG